MNFECAGSNEDDSFSAGKNALEQVCSDSTDLVYLFASTEHELEEVLEGAGEVAGDVPVIGCSSTVEISNGAETGSVVAGSCSRSPGIQGDRRRLRGRQRHSRRPRGKTLGKNQLPVYSPSSLLKSGSSISSCTCATRPGVLAIMKNPLPRR